MGVHVFSFFHENIICYIHWNHLIALLPLMSINAACSYRRNKEKGNQEPILSSANLLIIFSLG